MKLCFYNKPPPLTFVTLFRSAGVGRTGVFITLSIVLERMRYEGVVDIFQTVKMLRTQRPAMVQTEVSRNTPEEVFRVCNVCGVSHQGEASTPGKPFQNKIPYASSS